jgi:hypothetical protein
MSGFVAPEGINFSSAEDLSAHDLSEALIKIVDFIQQIDSSKKFESYDDWWEHDGLHFYRNSISPAELLRIVSSPESLSQAMPGDFCVFIGIAPADNSWYLRFYLNDEDDEVTARYDITFSEATAERFKPAVLKPFGLSVNEQDAETYYRSIIE